jgi:hypothetical protein
MTLIQKQRQFCIEIAQIKHKAGDLKLYKTMHALEVAEKEVGFEVAAVIEGKAKYAKESTP